MALRFLALQMDLAEQQRHVVYQRLDRAGLTMVYARGAFALFTNLPALCQVVPNGIVIGHVFSNTFPRRGTRFDKDVSIEISRTKGERLINTYWGAYAAILEDPESGAVHAVRDPSGALPCYVYRTANTWLISSDVETLVETGLVRLTVDFDQLGRHLFAPDLRTEVTAVAGLTEVLAGYRLTLPKTGAMTQRMCWSPWRFTERRSGVSAGELAEELRDLVTDCVAAWSSSFEHILLGLSGGLDSSILAASLKRAGVQATCLTMATHEADGDERRYAGRVAQALDLPLVEAFHELGNVDVTRATTAHLPRPVYYAFGQSEHQTKFELAQELSIDGFFTGIGGDNVFCSLQSATPIVDRFRVEGLGRGTIATINAVRDITGCSAAQAIRMAIRRYFSPSIYKWHGEPAMLNPELCAPWPARLNHPWLHGPGHVLPGKIVHVGMLARIQGTIDGFSRVDRPPQINPLLSQPIVEFCLSVPTWSWCDGGQNRSVARRAFGELLPAEVVNRTSKGGPDSFACLVIERNRKQLAAHLLDGLLARHKLIDTARIEARLANPLPLSGKECSRIAALGEAESWARAHERPIGPANAPQIAAPVEPSLAIADIALP